MLLAYRKDPSFYAVGQALGMHASELSNAALSEQRPMVRWRRSTSVPALARSRRSRSRPRRGWWRWPAARRRSWAIRTRCGRRGFWPGMPASMDLRQGHACLSRLAQGTVCKILDAQEVKPHKVRYYLERRDPEFKAKMAQVLCVYREVKILKKAAAAATKKNKKPSEAVTVISYDEKPGIQAIATTAPDLPPEPGVHPTFTREFEYKRHGTVSLLAGIDLITGKVHALVKDRHRSREFIEFLKLIDAAYPTHTAIRLILDNHSAHISKETKAWLANRPAGRFEFTFTPKHGSWLNLVEGFFSKLARSVLRHIRVASKQELKDRIMAAMDHFNRKSRRPHLVLQTQKSRLI